MTNEILWHLNKKFFLSSTYCPFTHSNFILHLCYFCSTYCYFYVFYERTKNNKKIKWKITFWISHSFASFAKKVIFGRNKKWKRGGKIKQRKSFLFFPFGNIFLFYIEEGMKIEGKHILGHYHHYQLNDFSHCILFPLSCLVKCLDWCFNFIPFI